MCSMLLTVVVSARSSVYTIRCSISFALKPVYCQMTLTTGMLMDGKMSVGVRRRINGVNNNNSRATTTNVRADVKLDERSTYQVLVTVSQRLFQSVYFTSSSCRDDASRW